MFKKQERCIYNIDDYMDLVNANNRDYSPNDKLDILKKEIAQTLDDEESQLSRYLKTLSNNDKIALIRALILNDHNEIVKILSPAINADITLLKKIPEHESNQCYLDGNWLNDTVFKLINNMFKNKNKKNQEIEKIYIIQKVMESISDERIDLKSKRRISQEIDDITSERKMHLAYHETARYLSANRFSGNVNAKEFNDIVNNVSLDYSQYILISLGFLQKICNTDDDLEFLKNIRLNYINSNYEAAIEGIKSIFKKNHMSDCPKELNLQNVDIRKNYSRRFFEMRLAQLYYGQFDAINNINKIIRYFINEPIQEEEVKDAILKIAELHDEDIEARHHVLQEESPLFQNRNRSVKPIYSTRTDESFGKKSESVYSKNPSVLLSNQPIFVDELLNNSLRNKAPDINTYSNDSIYSAASSRSIYVAAISGHAYYMVAMLEKYMKDNSTDKELNNDVNNFIKAYIMSYVLHGYHSLHELTQLFEENNIKTIFEQYSVKIDLTWSDKLLEQASKDTQEYVKEVCKRQVLHQELANDPLFTKQRDSAEKATTIGYGKKK